MRNHPMSTRFLVRNELKKGGCHSAKGFPLGFWCLSGLVLMATQGCFLLPGGFDGMSVGGNYSFMNRSSMSSGFCRNVLRDLDEMTGAELSKTDEDCAKDDTNEANLNTATAQVNVASNPITVGSSQVVASGGLEVGVANLDQEVNGVDQTRISPLIGGKIDMVARLPNTTYYGGLGLAGLVMPKTGSGDAGETSYSQMTVYGKVGTTLGNFSPYAGIAGLMAWADYQSTTLTPMGGGVVMETTNTQEFDEYNVQGFAGFDVKLYKSITGRAEVRFGADNTDFTISLTQPLAFKGFGSRRENDR